MSLFKMVDGVQVALTSEEAAAIQAEWAANAAAVLVPAVLSPRQFRQSLTHFGLRATVESAVASADQDTRDWYEFATQFERRHPRVTGMAQALGFTDAQVDAVWTFGAAL